MSNETKKRALPKLRFPEFQQAPEWEEKKFGEIAPLQRGFDLPTYELKTGTIPVVFSNGIQKFHSEGRATAPGIVTGRSGTIGKIHFIKEGEYWPHNTSLWVTDFNGNDPEFIYFLYKSVGTGRFASGSGVPTLNRNDVHAFKTHIPSVHEQRKIAAILSSLDELIAAQSDKLTTIQEHKRGLMQGIFPAEGEMVPKLRFPDFQDSEEWEEKTLGEVVTFSSGGTPSKDKPEYWGGNTPWISASSMHGYVIDKSELYITDVAKKTGAATVGKGILLLLVRGSMLFKRIPMGITAREVAFNQDVKALHIDKGIAPQYLLYYLVSAESLLLAMVSATGIGAGKLDTSELKQFPVFIPSSAEQEKIIECLSTVDDSIIAQTQKIEALKLHKKGLMQGLFPALTNTEA